MIESLTIKNFKCFENQSFEFGNLTLLSGLNGTGKSSVFQSLLLLRQSNQQRILENGLLLNGDLVKLGTAKDIFYEKASDYIFGFDIKFSGNHNASWQFNYDSETDIPRLISKNVSKNIYNNNLFTDSFHYLTAERIGPRTSFAASDYFVNQHKQIGISGEYTSHFLSLFEEQDIENEKGHPKEKRLELKPQVVAWLDEISPGVQIETIEYKDMDLVSLRYAFIIGDQKSNFYRSTNVGFGITYTLPIVVALLASKQNALILLENPEAHLHPKGQFTMGELIARTARCGVQVIVETHSDHILNGIRVAVHDKKLEPSQLRIYFLDRNKEKGQMCSKVIALKIDKDGRIDKWPDGFFDEWDKSLERLID